MTVRIFKNRVFARFARRSRLDDAMLAAAVDRAEQGLIDADFGGGVVKQRIPRPGAGRSGGFRTIVLFRAEERAVFVYGFAKNQRDNIGADELAQFKRLAAFILALGEDELDRALAAGALIEVQQ